MKEGAKRVENIIDEGVSLGTHTPWEGTIVV